jgi:hypothetical protein
MADSGTGIQELMAAETRASQIVAEARIGRFSMQSVVPWPQMTAVVRRKTISISFALLALGESFVLQLEC